MGRVGRERVGREREGEEEGGERNVRKDTKRQCNG